MPSCLIFFAFEADVGDPVLAAAIGAAGDVDAELLLEAGDAVVELVGEPAGEAFGFGESEFAELGAGAGDGGASEGGGANRQSGGGEFAGDADGVAIGNVHDDEVLHHGVADVAVAVLVGKIGGEAELVGSDAAAEDVGADVREAELFLRVDADVIAVDVGRDFFRLARVEFEADAFFEVGEEAFGRPAVLEEEKFQTGALAIFAEDVLGAEEVGDAAGDRDDLIPCDESVEANGEMRIGGEAAADANREAGFEAA